MESATALELSRALAPGIGRRLRWTRVRRGLTLLDVASSCDDRPNVQLLSLIERGHHAPATGTLVKLCRVLGTSADYLLGFREWDEGEEADPLQ